MCSSEFAFFPFGLATFCYLPSIFQSMEVEINYGNIILHFIYSRYLHSINSQTETRNRKSNFDHFLGEIKKSTNHWYFLYVWVWWLKDIAFAMCMPCHAIWMNLFVTFLKVSILFKSIGQVRIHLDTEYSWAWLCVVFSIIYARSHRIALLVRLIHLKNVPQNEMNAFHFAKSTFTIEIK